MDQKAKKWMPSMVFYNTKDKTEATFKDESSFATLELTGNDTEWLKSAFF
jgi:hypothetical protein